jgi:hypothetical protein
MLLKNIIQQVCSKSTSTLTGYAREIDENASSVIIEVDSGPINNKS